jgi:hypothetical protein
LGTADKLVFASSLLVPELPVELFVLLDAVPDGLSDFCVLPLGSVADGIGAVAIGSCTVTDSTGAIDLLITEFGFVGLIGLTGDVGLLIFVIVIVQVSDVVDHDVQVGEEYGSEHVDDLFCVIDPL